MATRIENRDLFGDDLFKKTEAEVKALITQIDLLEKGLVKIATTQQKVLNNQDQGTVQSIQATKGAVDKLNNAEQIAQKVRKEKLNLEQKLKAGRKQQSQDNQVIREQIIEETKERKKLARESLGLTSAYQKESARLNDLRNKYKELALAEKGTTKESKKLLREIQQLDTKLKGIDKTVGQSQRNVGNYGSAFSKLGGVLKSGLGLLGITAGLAGVVSLMKNSVKIFTDFESANSNLEAVLGATKDEMKLLSDNAKLLGASTSFTASEVVGLQTSFARLGFPTEDILKMTESTLNAAAAMGSGLDETAALTGSTLKAFGLDASEAGRVNDVLAKSTSASALDFGKLSTAMSTIAPVANSFGFSVEGTTALLGQLSNAGFDASSSATATRNILLNLADSNGALAKSLKEPVKDLPSLVRGLKQLKGEGIDLGKALKLTDKRSVAAFSTFLEGADDVLDLNNALLKAGGTAQQMADTQLDNLAGKTKILNSAWEGLVLSILDGNGAFTDIAQTVVEVATGFVEWLTVTESLSEELQKQADSLISITVAMNDVNTNTSTRLALIDELNATYPQLIKNLGFEKVGLENVNEVLQAVNKNMVERVNIQKAVEDQTNANNGVSLQAETRQKVLAAFILKGTKNLQENGLAHLLVGKTLEEQSKIIQENQTFWQGFTNELRSVDNATQSVNNATKSSNEAFEENRKFVLSTIKSRKDLENLSTEELRSLVKSNLLKGLRLQLDAKEIIILRERVSITKEETEATNESTDAIGKKTKKTRELTGLIEKQSKAISDLQEELKRATSEEEIFSISFDIKFGQEELERLKRIASSTREEFNKQTLDLIDDQTDREIEKEKAKSEKLIKLIQTNSKTTTKEKEDLIEKEVNRLDKFIEQRELKRQLKVVKDAEALSKAEFEQRRTGFKTEEEFEKEKSAQFLAIKRKALEDELALLEDLGGEETKVRQEQIKAQLEGMKKLGEGAGKLKEAFSNAIEVIGDLVDESFEKKLESIDKALERTGDRIDSLRSKANEGQLDAQESLAFEQKRQAELEREQERTRKRQEKAKAFFTVLTAFNENDGDLGKTISDISVLKGLASGLTAYDGVDDTGGRGSVDKKGGKIWTLHPNEQVWSKKDRGDVGFRNRDEIKQIVGLYDNGVMSNMMNFDKSQEIINPIAFKLNGMGGSSEIVSKLTQLNHSIQGIDIPEGMVNIDEVRGLINLISKKGNKVTTERSKLHK